MSTGDKVVPLNEAPKIRDARKRLKSLQKVLDDSYQEVEIAREKLTTAEETAIKTELAYNKVLEEYAELVGIGNIEIDYLSYATIPIDLSAWIKAIFRS